MKICLLTSTFPAYKGDSRGTFVYQLSSNLSEKVVLNVVCPYYKSSKNINERFGDIGVHRFKYLFGLGNITERGGIPTNLNKLSGKIQVPFFMFSFFLKAKKLAKDADVIHANWILAGFVGVVLKKILKKPLVVTLRGSDVKLSVNDPLLKKILKYVLKNSDAVTTVSNDLKMDVLKLGIDKRKVSFIPNGVDVVLFRKRDKMASRKNLDLPYSRIILYIGRIVKDKGLFVLLKALSGLKNVTLILIGSGKDQTKLSLEAEKLKISRNVVFLGEKKHSEIPSYCNAADIFVLPSFSEGRPNVILETMASGTPIISTKVGGIPELIEDNRNGFLVVPGNPNDLRNKIELLLKNPTLAKKFTDNGFLYLKKNNLTWSSTSEKYLDIYKKIKL